MRGDDGRSEIRFDAYRALGYFTARQTLAQAKGRAGELLAGPWRPAGVTVSTVDLTAASATSAEKGGVLVE